LYIFKILVYWFLLSFHFCWKDILYIGWCSGVSGRALAYKAWDTEFKPHYCPKKVEPHTKIITIHTLWYWVILYYQQTLHFHMASTHCWERERQRERKKTHLYHLLIQLTEYYTFPDGLLVFENFSFLLLLKQLH
jgi:hypothetical protein